MRRWEEKKAFYKKNGIEEGKISLLLMMSNERLIAKIDKIIVNTFDLD